LRRLTLDGILAVQAGDNPRVVAEKLSSYIAPEERDNEDEAKVADINQARDAEAA
jgi:chemotaxis protein MotA